MDRKNFLKNSLLIGSAAVVSPIMLKAKNIKLKESNYDKMMENVGFNHLPNKEEKTMNTVLHRAETRGTANHGWLKANFTFSFANYYNPDRMNFGVLRVMNDDYIEGGKGFSTHPHDNMEIITIPIEGGLEHKDSMGNGSVIRKNDIQVMSAGTGIFHSEFNASKTVEANTLQIWMFPNKRNVEPRYDQQTFLPEKMKNKLQQVLSPNKEDDGVWVHQNAWFHLGHFDKGKTHSYSIKRKENGVYIFLIKGKINVNGQDLLKRDGYGLWNIDKVDIKIEENAEFLIMDVPMEI